MANYAYKDKVSKTDVPENHGTDPGTSYEVFRNNTTAVEVIVKDILNKKKKSNLDISESKIIKLQNEVDTLKGELDNATKSLAKARKNFQTIIREMKKQIDIANTRETETMAINLKFKLENEKLKILLNSKTKLATKLRKELVTLKRVLKFVIKNVCNTPEIANTVSIGSDPEYEDFETDLKKNIHVKFLDNNYNATDTFDSTISKEFDSKT